MAKNDLKSSMKDLENRVEKLQERKREIESLFVFLGSDDRKVLKKEEKEIEKDLEWIKKRLMKLMGEMLSAEWKAIRLSDDELADMRERLRYSKIEVMKEEPRFVELHPCCGGRIKIG